MKNFNWLLLILLFCNNANSTETKAQTIARIQKIDQEKLDNSNKIHQLIEDNLGKSIRGAQAQLQQVQSRLIPSLQKEIDIIQTQATEYQILQPKYEKLKWFCCVVAWIAIFFTVDRFLGIVPPPMKYYISAGVASIVFTILAFKI